MSQIATELEAIVEQDIPLTGAITLITEHQLEQGISFEQALRHGELLQYREGDLKAYGTSKSRFEELDGLIKHELKQGREMVTSIIADAHTTEDAEEFVLIGDALHKIEQHHASFMQVSNNIFTLIDKAKFEEAEALVDEAEGFESQLNHETESLLNEIETFTQASGLRVEQHEHHALIVLITLASITFVIGGALNVFMVKNFTRRLAVTAENLQALANGNLTRTIELSSKDEIGQLQLAIKFLNEKLGEIVSGVKATANDLHLATREIASGTTELAQQTEEQASALQQSASSMEEITTVVQNTAGNATEANTLAKSTQEVAEQGATIVSQAIDVMEKANDSSQKVADIITTIDDIAFQTNLLALNAAVEAARAGDQGRGFAVVASEVRNLALQCATAASEVKVLVESSVLNVTKGTTLVNRSGNSLEDIVNSVKNVGKVVSEITAASQEQALGIDLVNQAVIKIDDGTLRNAAQVQQMAVASQSMAEVTKTLIDQVGFFRVNADIDMADTVPSTAQA